MWSILGLSTRNTGLSLISMIWPQQKGERGDLLGVRTGRIRRPLGGLKEEGCVCVCGGGGGGACQAQTLRCSSMSCACSESPVEYHPTTSCVLNTCLSVKCSVPAHHETAAKHCCTAGALAEQRHNSHCSCFLMRKSWSTTMPSDVTSYLNSKELQMSTVLPDWLPRRQPSTLMLSAGGLLAFTRVW